MQQATIATLKEIKNNENRVGLIPEGVQELKKYGHRVLVQTGAGEGAGFSDEDYQAAGAEILVSPEEIVREATIIVKVKEPLPEEYPLLEGLRGKTLYTYLHLSGVDPELTNRLLENQVTGIAYETVKDGQGNLPLLAPMSSVAGVLAIQYAAEYLQKKYHGVGITLGEIPGTERAKVLVIGGGVVGFTAAKTAVKMGSKAILLDINNAVIESIKNSVDQLFTDEEKSRFKILKSTPEIVSDAIREADVLIGAVLVAGKKAPTVVSEEQIKSMKKGAVIVDVAIDQGGCVWGTRATSHDQPIYEIDGKYFCCVANMPGQVAKQSTQALTNATLPYLVKMANEGVVNALLEDADFALGLNTYQGKIICQSVAEDLNKMDKFGKLEDLL